jgi:hypothetical protein
LSIPRAVPDLIYFNARGAFVWNRFPTSEKVNETILVHTILLGRIELSSIAPR